MSLLKCPNPKSYKVDVSQFLSLCERNYHHIQLWMPEVIKQGSSWRITGDFGCLLVRLLEDTKYTQLIEISRKSLESAYLTTPKMEVRVYHDAKLAEVLTSQQISKLHPVYDYPNTCMHQPDEKYQVNAFLETLLKISSHKQIICLEN